MIEIAILIVGVFALLMVFACSLGLLAGLAVNFIEWCCRSIHRLTHKDELEKTR